jgi:branched-chain amino acid transport system substrate-binding protein
MNKRWVGVVGLLFGLLLLIFCARPGLSAESKIIKFGTGLPLSGPAYTWGVNFDRFIRKATDDINKAGGIDIGGVNYKWQVITYDHGYVPARALDVAKRLVDGDKVDIVSIMGGGVQTMCLDFLSSRKILHFATGTAHHYWIGPKWPLNFSYWPPAEASLWGMTKYLGRLGIKTAVFTNPDEDHGRAHSKARVAQMEAVGVKSLGEDFYPRGNSEFYPMLRRLLAKNPDLVDVGTGGTRECGLQTKQLREIGYKGPILAWALSKGQVEKIVPKESLENVITATQPPFWKDLPMEGKTKELFNWYVSNFDINEWDSASLAPHSMMELLTLAIKKAQSLDPYKLAAALETIDKNNTIETASGKTCIDAFDFGIPRVMSFPYATYRFENGKWVQMSVDMPSLEWQKK